LNALKKNIIFLNLPLIIGVTVLMARHAAFSLLIISQSTIIHWSLTTEPMLNVELVINHIQNIWQNIPCFLAHKMQFFPEKCDRNSTCVLYAEGKYYFETYKYPYIYYTVSLSWDSEICFQIIRSGITACEQLTCLSGDLP
jgi:hypothetical protein